MKKYVIIICLMLIGVGVQAQDSAAVESTEGLPGSTAVRLHRGRSPQEMGLRRERRKTGWFRYAPYGHSLYADVHPYMARMDVAALSNNDLYDFASTGKKYRCYTEGLFGLQLPIWCGNFQDGQFGLSLSMCLSADLWLDVFEYQTAPVVNTDYRIGAPTTTFIHRLNRGFAQNYSITWSPFKHESTHLGDEHQIRRMEADYALRRVNVSYNYTELQFTLNEPEDRFAQCHTFRAGLMLLWNPKAGWYFVNDIAGDGDPTYAHPHMSPWEAYLQYQYQSPTGKRGWQGIASAEVRNRALYGYDLTALKDSEQTDPRQDSRRFTYNIFVGARYNIKGYDGYLSRVSFGIRAYHGNCPYGMFRSVDNFSQIGTCVIFQ